MNTDGLGEEAKVVLVVTLLTVWTRTAEALLLKSVLPLYVAVMECGPGGKAGVENVAFPLASVPLPSIAAPFLNVTVPVGVPLPGAAANTLAVKVTDCPNTDGLREETTVVLVEALLTVCDSAADVLARNAPLPGEVAVMA